MIRQGKRGAMDKNYLLWFFCLGCGQGAAPTEGASELTEVPAAVPTEAGHQPAEVWAPDPSLRGKILYIHEEGEAQDLWEYDFSTQKSKRLDGPPGKLFPGPVDPQGSILVIALEGGLQRLYLLPAEGGPARLLAPPAERLRSPVWSPDGKWLYIEASWKSFGDLYRVPREGGEPARLTAEPGGSFEPALSPDGSQLAFGSSRDGNAEIYVMPSGGGPAQRLTDDPGDDMSPRWGSAGKLYWLSRRSGAAHFWAMNLSKTPELEPLRRSPDDGEELDLLLSPDRSLAAITVQRPPNRVDIEVIDLADHRLLCKLDGEGADEHPTFSPDGQWIAFESARSGDMELWIVRPDGRELRQLSQHAGADWLPRWLPPPSP